MAKFTALTDVTRAALAVMPANKRDGKFSTFTFVGTRPYRVKNFIQIHTQLLRGYFDNFVMKSKLVVLALRQQIAKLLKVL